MKEILKCFECKKKTDKLTRFMCTNCYRKKYYKGQLEVHVTCTPYWICDCVIGDLNPKQLLQCLDCGHKKPTQK